MFRATASRLAARVARPGQHPSLNDARFANLLSTNYATSLVDGPGYDVLRNSVEVANDNNAATNPSHHKPDGSKSDKVHQVQVVKTTTTVQTRVALPLVWLAALRSVMEPQPGTTAYEKMTHLTSSQVPHAHLPQPSFLQRLIYGVPESVLEQEAKGIDVSKTETVEVATTATDGKNGFFYRLMNGIPAEILDAQIGAKKTVSKITNVTTTDKNEAMVDVQVKHTSETTAVQQVNNPEEPTAIHDTTNRQHASKIQIALDAKEPSAAFPLRKIREVDAKKVEPAVQHNEAFDGINKWVS
jgi:hypothetical protein